MQALLKHIASSILNKWFLKECVLVGGTFSNGNKTVGFQQIGNHTDLFRSVHRQHEIGQMDKWIWSTHNPILTEKARGIYRSSLQQHVKKQFFSTTSLSIVGFFL